MDEGTLSPESRVQRDGEVLSAGVNKLLQFPKRLLQRNPKSYSAAAFKREVINIHLNLIQPHLKETVGLLQTRRQHLLLLLLLFSALLFQSEQLLFEGGEVSVRFNQQLDRRRLEWGGDK